MKRILLTSLVCILASQAGAQETTFSYSLNPTNAIPDGNPVGLMSAFDVSGVGGTITDIQLNLNITGGFNGNLYAYLVDPLGNFAVLLNRVGLAAGNPVGYSDSGFNIALDGASSDNIHNYQDGSYTIGGGQLTGTWAADGRNINPQSSGTVFDAADANATLSIFNGVDGMSVNGMWTFFIADLSSGGGAANLNSLTLNIKTVPEPSVLTLSLLAALLAASVGIRRLVFSVGAKEGTQKRTEIRRRFDAE